MWLFTKDGFYSVVQKPHQKGTGMVTVRTRNKDDMLHVIKALGIGTKHLISDEGTDYEYRIEVNKTQWSEYVTMAIADIEYDNFKHEVEKHDPERAHIYLGVWSTLLRTAK